MIRIFEAFEKTRLPFSQIHLLLILEEEKASPSYLARCIKRDRSTVTDALRKLERKSLITTTLCKMSPGRKWVSLTSKGRKIVLILKKINAGEIETYPPFDT